MSQTRNYVVDTNVLLEDPDCIFKLRNGNENNVYIPYHVLLELNRLKKDLRLGKIVSHIIQNLIDHKDKFNVLKANHISDVFSNLVDHHILDEIIDSGLDDPTLVTNDKILGIQADLKNIKNENYKRSVPFNIDADYYTGFTIPEEENVVNSFF